MKAIPLADEFDGISNCKGILVIAIVSLPEEDSVVGFGDDVRLGKGVEE